MYFYEVEGQDREKAVRKAETIFEQLDENGDGIYCICGKSSNCYFEFTEFR